MLGALPKDSRDLDLPQRLAGWAADPVASRHKADSYIRHWFGKVKRVSPHRDAKPEADCLSIRARQPAATGSPARQGVRIEDAAALTDFD